MKISRIIFLILAGAVVFAVTACTLDEQNSTEEVLEQFEVEDKEPVNTMDSEENGAASDKIDILVAGGAVDIDVDIPEEELQQMIHEMTHQKVIADSKWGSVQLTQERVYALLDLIDADPNRFEHYDVYRPILIKWSNSDFSSVDQDHNRIWQLQGGTIGYAQGIMTPEQEEAYVKKNFK